MKAISKEVQLLVYHECVLDDVYPMSDLWFHVFEIYSNKWYKFINDVQ
jgi:hypothetical protein